VVGRLWVSIWNWYRKRYANYHTTHVFRFHCHSARWYAAERLWLGLGYISVYCCQHLIKHSLAFS
jgi:hypothetical protein